MSGKFFALFSGLAVLCFFALGRAELSNPDEGRYAEIPREMLASGDWVTPRLDGVAYFEKPPLVYWVEAAAQRVLGRSEWAVRTPVAVFALAGALMTYGVVRRRFGEPAAFAAGGVLGTSAFYAAFSHILSLDLAVAVLISATLFAFFLAVQEPPGGRRRSFFYAMYAAAALATLTKGLIGVLLTGAVMLLWLAVCGQWRRLRPFYLPTGLLLFAAIAVPWHVLAAQRNPAWAHFYFVHEQWERFFTNEHNRTGPIYYFIPEIFPGMFPWFGFLFAASAAALRGGWSRRREPARADRWFFFLWAALVFLFFSKSQSKLPGYILPVLPPLAVLIGLYLSEREQLMPREGEVAARRFFSRASGGTPLLLGYYWFSGCCVLLSGALLVVATVPGRVRLPAWQAAGLRPEAILLAAGLLTAGIVVLKIRRPTVLVAAAGIFLLVVVDWAAPFLFKPGTKALAELVSRADPGQTAAVYHYHEFFHDFPYYARRTVKIVGFTGELEPYNDPSATAREQFVSEQQFRQRWAQPEPAFAVARKTDVAALFADPGFHYRLLGESRSHYLFSNHP